MSLYKLNPPPPILITIFLWICSSCILSYLSKALNTHTHTHTCTLHTVFYGSLALLSLLSPFALPPMCLIPCFSSSFCPQQTLHFLPSSSVSALPSLLTSPLSLHSSHAFPFLCLSSLSLSFPSFPNSSRLLSATLPHQLSVLESDYIREGSRRPWRPVPRSNLPVWGNTKTDTLLTNTHICKHNHKHYLEHNLQQNMQATHLV